MKVNIEADMYYLCTECGRRLKVKRDGRKYLYHPVKFGVIFKKDSTCFNAGRNYELPAIEVKQIDV